MIEKDSSPFREIARSTASAAKMPAAKRPAGNIPAVRMSAVKKMSAAKIPAAKVSLAGSAAILLLSGCAKPAAAPAGPMGPMPVHAVRVTASDVPVTGSWVGTMDGYVNANIQPQVTGYLVKQLYQEGSTVSKGQVLFQIDPRPFQASLDQAQGQLLQAQGSLGQAQGQVGQAQAALGLQQINVNRDTPLANERAIAQSQLDNDKQGATQAQASVRSAQAQTATAQGQIATSRAQIATARLNLGFTQVRSLISGVAGQATTQVGNLVSPQSVLTAVSQLNPIKVYFSISDAEYLDLVRRAQGGHADLLHIGTRLPLTLSLASGDKYPQPGHIIFVDRQINQQTGAIRIAAAFPNPGNVLRPGQFGRVSADTQILHNALQVPQIAVTELQGEQQVHVVGPDSKVHVVTIQLGPQIGANWVVTSGLQPGAEVIIDQLQKLAEGVPVKATLTDASTQPVASTSNDATGR